MKAILFALLICYQINLSAQDTILTEKDTIETSKLSVFLQTNFIFNYGNKISGGGIIYSFNKIKIIGSISLKHRSLFMNKDSIYSNLPYSITDSSIFYEVRSYTNQKSYLNLGLETNFKPFKKYALQLGVLALFGKYKFQDYQADTYYNYYRDTTTNLVYYHDNYGYPSWDPLDAQTYVLRYSKSDMEYRMIGIEPYLDLYSDINSFFRTSLNLSMRYEQYNSIKRNYLDYAGILNNPADRFHKWRFNVCFRFIFKPTTKNRNSPKT